MAWYSVKRLSPGQRSSKLTVHSTMAYIHIMRQWRIKNNMTWSILSCFIHFHKLWSIFGFSTSDLQFSINRTPLLHIMMQFNIFNVHIWYTGWKWLSEMRREKKAINEFIYWNIKHATRSWHAINKYIIISLLLLLIIVNQD